MDTSQTIPPEILNNDFAEPDNKQVQTAVKKHGELTQLLEYPLASITGLARLTYAAQPVEEFELISKGKLMKTQSFYGSLQQVVTETCESISMANEQCIEAQTGVIEIQSQLSKLVPTLGEAESCAQSLANLTEMANKCASAAMKAAKKFAGRVNVVEQVSGAFLGTTKGFIENIHAKDFDAISLVLQDEALMLDNCKDLWAHIALLFSNIACYGVIMASSIAQPKSFILSAVEATILAARAAAITNAYQETYKMHVEGVLKDFTELAPEAKSNRDRLLDIEYKCILEVDKIAQKLSLSKEKLAENLSIAIDQQSTQGAAKILELINREDRAHEIYKHSELDSVLVSGPMNVAKLAELCLISTTTTDFKLEIPKDGFKYINSDWFRAALHQVVNTEATSAAMASKNIAQIERHTKSVPTLVLDILRLILIGEARDIKSMLPEKMEEVLEKTNKCDKLSTEVETTFNALNDLIQELAEACTATRSAAEAKNANANSSSDPNTAQVDESLVTIQLTETNFKIIQKSTIDKVKALGGIRRQWAHLTRFFGELMQTIEIEVQQPLGSFKEKLQKHETKTEKKKQPLSPLVKQTLRTQVQLMAQKGLQSNMVTAVYLDISERHIHTPLLSLDELLTLTPDDMVLVEYLFKDIQRKCEQSQGEILAMLERNRIDAAYRFRSQMAAIEKADQLLANEQAREEGTM